MTRKTITFVLPTSGRLPSGGHRVVYEHANYLARQNHNVTILHLSHPAVEAQSMRATLRPMVRFLRDRFERGYRPDRWFKLDDRVRTMFRFSQRTCKIVPCDILIATAWETAGLVAKTDSWRKYYFIQSLETWSGPEADVLATWRLPMSRIVVSDWLKTTADQLGVEAQVVGNGIDLALFRMNNDVAGRNPSTVLFSSMEKPLKGSRDVVDAINILRTQGRDLRILSFGQVDPHFFGLQKPYLFVKNPSQEGLVELYNEAAIFITASHLEGWGMTMTEAAACGSALVVSDIGGHRSFARTSQNALTFPIGDPTQIASALDRLIANPLERIALANQAYRDAQELSWSSSSQAFERAILAPHPPRDEAIAARIANSSSMAHLLPF